MSRYDFVTFGNYTKDTIVSAAGTRFVDGGGPFGVVGRVEHEAGDLGARAPDPRFHPDVRHGRAAPAAAGQATPAPPTAAQLK